MQKMVIANNGNVGIGTTAPVATLEVSSNAAGTPIFKAGNAANIGLVVSSNDNVGIGTTSPGKKLDVLSSDSQGAIRLLSGSAVGGAGSYTSYAIGRTSMDGYWGVSSQANDFLTGSAAGDIVFGSTGASNKLFLTTNGASRLAIDSAGNVGIGTTIPASKLSVGGDIGLFAGSYLGSGQSYDLSGAASSANLQLYSLGDGATRLNNVAGAIKLQTAGTDRLTVLNGGNVGIGTASPGSKLAVVGLPTYADNAAATTGGLSVGDFYRTSTGVVMVRY
jgi:hypothetical protein